MAKQMMGEAINFLCIFQSIHLLMAFTLAHTQGLVANVLPYNSGYLDECWVSGKSSFTARTPTSAAENHPNGSRF